MLLDGSVSDTSKRSQFLSDILNDIFDFNINDNSIMSSFNTKLSKISDIKSIININMKKQYDKYNHFQNNGRIGPNTVKLHRFKPMIRETIHSNDGVHLTSISNFASMRANTCVFEGKWMYETILETAGVQQIGWATLDCKFSNEVGVGDSPDSYAFDGKRIKKWNLEAKDYGESWNVGDIIGSCIDFDNKTIRFYRNGKDLGIAFDNIQTKEENITYFPTISLSFGERCILNYGSFPFHYPIEGYSPLQVDGNIIHHQSKYLINCIKKLLPHLQQLLNTDIKEKQNITTSISNKIIEQQLSYDDILLCFGNIFSFFIPLLIKSKASSLLFIDLLCNLNENLRIELMNICYICFYDNKDEYYSFLDNLFLALVHKSLTASWIPPNSGSTIYLQLYLSLIKIHKIAKYFKENTKIFYSTLERLLDIKYPTLKDLEIIFPFKNELEELSNNNNNYISKPYTFDDINNSMKENHLNMINIFKYLLSIDNNHPLSGLLITWINRTIIRNKQKIPPPLFSNKTLLFNIYTTLLSYVSDDLISSSCIILNIRNYFCNPDRNINDYTRVGGTFSHLQKEYPRDYTESEIQVKVTLFEFILHLNTFCVAKLIERAGSRLLAYKDTCNKLSNNENTNISLRNILESRVLPQARLYYWDKIYFLNDNIINNMWNLSYQLGNIFTYAKKDDIFHYIPEYYLTSFCDLFFLIERGTLPTFNYSSNENKNHFQQSLSFLISSISSKDIINPDVKDKVLALLILFMKQGNIIQLLEENEYAKTNFIPSLIESFSIQHFWLFISDIITSFWKGISFGKEYNNEGSLIYQKELTKYYNNNTQKMNEFLNDLFTNMNSVLTEFRVATKNQRGQIFSDENNKKKASLMFDLTGKLLKIAEILSITCPEIFITNELNMIRLVEFILGALITLNSKGPYNDKFQDFIKKVSKKQNAEYQYKYTIYSPIARILLNLSDYYVNIQENDKLNNEIYSIINCFIKVDSEINMDGFTSFNEFQWEKVKQTTTEGLKHDIPLLKDFMNKLKEQYIIKQTIKLNEKEEDEEEDDDNICSICYSNTLDTIFEPCKHTSCKQCITRHLLEHDNCFFCNGKIDSTKLINSEEK